jgi:hypothetical protein
VKQKFLLALLFLGSIGGSLLSAQTYTAVAVSEPPPARHRLGSDRYGYWSSNTQPPQIIEQKALQLCRQGGGVDPKLVISTGAKGYFAIAVSGDGTTVGWSGPLPTWRAADAAAMAQCKQRGGYFPNIRAQWQNREVNRRSRDRGPVRA